MEIRYYALVGHCKMTEGLQQGVGVYRYDPESAEMTPAGRCAQDMRVGCQTYDPRRKKLYAVDEFWSLPGRVGGGGRVAALTIREDGEIVRTSIRNTCGANPSYAAVDKTGKYLLVTHHCMENFVTHIVGEKGNFQEKVFYDDCTMLLLRLTENGEIGEILDVVHILGYDEDNIHRFPHLHCVVPDQSREHFIVCDKGLDKISCWRIHYEAEKLVKCWEEDAKPHSEPRYCCFHPHKPVFYCNHESSTDIAAYTLDKTSGHFQLLNICPSVSDAEAEGASPSDIVIHSGGKYIFTSLRKIDKIAVLEIQDDMSLVCRQVVSCGGVNPRGLCVSPDGRFLLAANLQSASVQVFSISDRGFLTAAHCVDTGGYPGNIQIIAVQAGMV